MLQQRVWYYTLTFICLLAIASFLASPFFQVRYFEFYGLNILEEKDFAEIYEEYNLRNIFLVDTRKIVNNLIENKYIKELKVVKRYPAKLVIEVNERIPLGKINLNGKYLVFTETGYIIEEGAKKTRVQVPEIENIAYEFQGDKLIFTPLLEKIVQALAIINQNTREKIANISSKEDEITLNLFPFVPVNLGEAKQLTEKFRVLQSIVDKIVNEDLQVEYIDLRILQRPALKLK